MTNEEILREYTDDVCSGGHAQKAFLRALRLARADELRKAAAELGKCVSDEAVVIALSLKQDADELELEATK